MTTIVADKFKVDKVETGLKWSSRLKSPIVALLSKGTACKATRPEYGGILAMEAYIIGTAVTAWKIRFNSTNAVYVGVSVEDGDVESQPPPPTTRLITPLDDTFATCTLSGLSLVIDYRGKKYTIDLTAYNGLTMYAYASGVNLRVGISASEEICMSVEDGVAVISTVNTSGRGIPLKLETGGAGLLVDDVPVSRGVFISISDANAVSNTTTETDMLTGATLVGSRTTAANKLGVSAYHLLLTGIFSALNNNDLTIRFYGGPTSNVLLASIPMEFVTSLTEAYEIEIDMTVRKTGAAGTAESCVNIEFTYNDTGNDNLRGARAVVVNNTTFDTTAVNVWCVTIEWVQAAVLNSIQVQQAIFSQTY